MKKIIIGIVGFAVIAAAGYVFMRAESLGIKDDGKVYPKATKPNKTLIVYYSYSGNTKTVANYIHNAIGGDIVEIQTKNPYPKGYRDCVKQVKEEMDANFFPELTTKVDDLAEYDTILIGSPIWWYHIALPVSSFLKDNNLEGKQVALFTTHGGGGKANADLDMEAALPKSTILKSFTKLDKMIKVSLSDVDEWLVDTGIKQ